MIGFYVDDFAVRNRVFCVAGSGGWKQLSLTGIVLLRCCWSLVIDAKIRTSFSYFFIRSLYQDLQISLVTCKKKFGLCVVSIKIKGCYPLFFNCLLKPSPVVKVASKTIKNWSRYLGVFVVLVETWGCYPFFQLSHKIDPCCEGCKQSC